MGRIHGISGKKGLGSWKLVWIFIGGLQEEVFVSISPQ